VHGLNLWTSKSPLPRQASHVRIHSTASSVRNVKAVSQLIASAHQPCLSAPPAHQARPDHQDKKVLQVSQEVQDNQVDLESKVHHAQLL